MVNKEDMYESAAKNGASTKKTCTTALLLNIELDHIRVISVK